MDVFLSLFTNIIPLYVLIALGFVAGRVFHIGLKTLASLALNIFVPVAVFGFIVKTDFNPQYALLPLIAWLIPTLVATLFLQIGKRAYPDSRANLLGISAAMGNTGFFGIPIILVLFPPEIAGIYAFMNIGIDIFMSTVMHYIASRGVFSVKESLLRLVRFPVLHAVLLGLIVNAAGFEFSTAMLRYHDYFVGAMVVSGMMLLGVSLSEVKKFVFAPRFIGLSYLGKFVLWPVIMLSIIMLDKTVFNLFDPVLHKAMFVFSVMPIGNTVVAFAGELDLNPGKASMTVLISTLLCLFTIPLMLIGFDILFPG